MKPVQLLFAASLALAAALAPAQACERDKTAASCQSGYIWDDASHACVPSVSS